MIGPHRGRGGWKPPLIKAVRNTSDIAKASTSSLVDYTHLITPGLIIQEQKSPPAGGDNETLDKRGGFAMSPFFQSIGETLIDCLPVMLAAFLGARFGVEVGQHSDSVKSNSGKSIKSHEDRDKPKKKRH